MSGIFGILSRYLTNGSLEPYIDYIKGHEERNRLINDEEKCEKVPELNRLRSLIIIPMQVLFHNKNHKTRLIHFCACFGLAANH